MNHTQYLLVKLAEEASEVAKAALKAAQFGLGAVNPVTDKTSFESLSDELNDLHAIIKMLNIETNMNYFVDTKAVKDKIEKVEYYKNISIENGCVDDNSVV